MQQDELDAQLSLECTFENCQEKPIGVCRNCRLQYCLEHASEVDPANYCCNCLVPADAEVLRAPLVDRDGVAHKGQVITPTGKAYRLSSKMVFEMTDQELKDFIDHERAIVHDIERIREYHLITLGMAEADVYRRDIAASKKVGETLKFGYETQFVPAISNIKMNRRVGDKSKAKATKTDKVVEMLSQLGLGAQDLVNLLRSTPSKKGK